MPKRCLALGASVVFAYTFLFQPPLVGLYDSSPQDNPDSDWCFFDLQAFPLAPSLALGPRGALVLHGQAGDASAVVSNLEDGSWVERELPTTLAPLETDALAADDNGTLHALVGRGPPGLEIEHFTETNGTWTSEVVPLRTASSAAIELDSRGVAHVAIEAHNLTSRLVEIHYGSQARDNWGLEFVAAFEAFGRGPALALSKDGPHVAYGVSQGRQQGILRYSAKLNGSWSFEDLTRNFTGPQAPGIVVDALGHPHLASGSEDGVEYFHHDENGWTRESVGNGTALNAAIALRPDGFPALAYFKSGPGEFALLYGLKSAQGWSLETVLQGSHVGGIQLRIDAAGIPHLVFYDVTRSVAVYGLRVPCLTKNSAPTANAGGPYETAERAAVVLDASGSRDAEGDRLTYRWDFNADGIWDTDWFSDPTATYTWGDDWIGTACVEVSDGSLADTACAGVTVRNVDPEILDAQAYVVVDVTLRVAGEKWHDVRMDVAWNNQLTGSAGVVRYPGSPDDRSATIAGGRVPLLGDFRITLYYTPDDDPVNGQRNGANPVWVILTMPDGSEAWLHHTFTVQQPDAWVWTVDDIRPYLIGQAITFDATAHDVGSDDLTFAWDFGDGATLSTIYHNKGVSPDPDVSPDVNSITVNDVHAHAYAVAGMYTVTLTVTDDDGGMTLLTFLIRVG